MRFGVLGPVMLWDAERRPVAVPGAKVRALLALLLVHRGAVVSADRIADALWDGRPPPKTGAVLRSKASQLRQALRAAGIDAGKLLRWESGGYVLDVDAADVDAGRAADLFAQAKAEPVPLTALELLAVAESCWRGAPFGEFRYERFALAAAAELDELLLQMREHRIGLRIDAGQAAAVVGEAARLAEEHPLRESAHVLLMKALYQNGRQADALAAYRSLAERLADRLGIDPGPQAVQCHTEILRQEQPLPPPQPPGGPLPALPAPLGPLVAREADLARLAERLRAHRLVTVTGPGGVGKTRLAVEAAREAAADLPDGAVFADLSAVRGTDAAAVQLALAEALGVRDDPATGPGSPGLWTRLASALLVKRMLLVLDNCEQAVDAVAPVVEALLRRSPELRVLATSREPLRLPGEHVMPLEPLSFPGDATEAAEPERYGAYRLFAALVADAGGTITSPASALRVVRRLDGLPLALELAAARVPALGLDHVERRLDDRFRLLAAGSRTAVGRHRTLEAVIAWSWDLIADRQRRALRRLSFPEDWTLDAAAALTGDDDAAATVAALADQSLVSADPSRPGRYRMLESVRQFARERLRDAGETAATADRHLAHCRDLVDRLAPRLRTEHQVEALRALREEAGNLRLALDAADEPLGLVLPLMWFWVLTGRLTEARHHLSAALARTAPGDPAAAIGRCWAEALRLRMGDGPAGTAGAPPPTDGPHAEAAGLAQAYLSLTRAIAGVPERPRTRAAHGPWNEAAVRLARATAALPDRPDLAETEAGACLDAFSALGDRWGELQALGLLAACADRAGREGRADALDRTALAAAELLHLPGDTSRILNRLGRRALARGGLEAAQDHYGRARVIAGEQCEERISAEAEGGLRAVAAARGGLNAPDVASAAAGRYLELVRLTDVHPGAVA